MAQTQNDASSSSLNNFFKPDDFVKKKKQFFIPDFIHFRKKKQRFSITPRGRAHPFTA